MKKVKIAMISKWFVHVERFTKLLKEYEESEIVAVWDYDVKRGKEFAEEIECPFVEDYEELLKNPEIDGFVIMAPVTMHEELIIKAVKAGKHIFTEKPLSVSRESAYRIRQAVKESGVKFIMSDPIVKPALIQVKQMIDEGVVGKITNVRIRNTSCANIGKPDHWALSHTSEEMGGGDLIDLGHHTIHILLYLLGKAKQVHASLTSFSEKAKNEKFEDNAVAVYQFANGVIGIAETGSLSIGSSYELSVYGDKGCIYSTKSHVKYCKEDGKWIEIRDEELPQGYPYILKYWLLGILENYEYEQYGIEDSVICLEMIMAAYEAAKKETEVFYRKQDT